MPTAKSAKEVLIGIAALLVFVAVAVMAGGVNEKTANSLMALFAAFILLQIVFQANVFQTFLSAHPVVTGNTASDTAPFGPNDNTHIPGSNINRESF